MYVSLRAHVGREFDGLGPHARGGGAAVFFWRDTGLLVERALN